MLQGARDRVNTKIRSYGISGNYVETFILIFTFTSLVVSKTKHFRDSWRYITSAFGPGVRDFDFWFGERSPGFPLIIKFAGDGFGLLAFHCLLSAFSWILLYRSLRAIRDVSQDHFFNVLFLFVAFSSVFTSWNFAVLTESASVSCFLVILSILFQSMVRPFSMLYLTIIPFLLLFSLLRDFNSIIAFLMILSSLVCSVFNKRKFFFSGLLIVSSCLLCLTFYSVKNLNHLGMKQRWILPGLNNFSQRIMTHEDWPQFSKDNHIPVSEELLDLKGQWGSSENLSYYKTKNLKTFRSWFMKKGDSSYRNFLIQYPNTTIHLIKSYFFKACQIMNCNTCHEYITGKEGPLFIRTPMAIVFLLIVIWLLKQLYVFRSQKNHNPSSLNPPFLFSLSLALISVFCVCLIILADPLEIQRHSILPLLMIVVSLMGMGLSMDKGKT